jgi:hypothetical protein
MKAIVSKSQDQIHHASYMKHVSHEKGLHVPVLCVSSATKIKLGYAQFFTPT